jgi:hypothetical protein
MRAEVSNRLTNGARLRLTSRAAPALRCAIASSAFASTVPAGRPSRAVLMCLRHTAAGRIAERQFSAAARAVSSRACHAEGRTVSLGRDAQPSSNHGLSKDWQMIYSVRAMHIIVISSTSRTRDAWHMLRLPRLCLPELACGAVAFGVYVGVVPVREVVFVGGSGLEEGHVVVELMVARVSSVAVHVVGRGGAPPHAPLFREAAAPLFREVAWGGAG